MGKLQKPGLLWIKKLAFLVRLDQIWINMAVYIHGYHQFDDSNHLTLP